jgi:hypothetical protein
MRKICNKCKVEKDLKEFNKKCDTKDKHTSFCKICINKDAEERRKNEDKNKHKEYDKQRYQEKKNIILEHKKEYYINNQEKILQQKAEYRKENSEINKIWRKNNREKINNNSKKYKRKNKHIEIWRGLVYRTIKYFNTIKEGHTIDMLGYSALEFKKHIENQFLHDMNWNNHGEVWEVDHIYPLTKFEKDTDVKIVNALSNLRPLYKELNQAKGNRIL